MKSRNFAEHCKNAMGTVFLLAGAFFVCSTFLSIRAVFADPIAPTNTMTTNTVQSPRSSSNVRTSARPATSRTTTSNVVSRDTGTTSSATVARGVTSRATTTTPATAVRTTATTTTSRPSMRSKA